MLDRYINKLNSVSKLNELVRCNTNATAFGMQSSGKYHIISLLEERVLYIVKDSYLAIKAVNEIEKMTSKDVVYLPPKDDVLTIAEGYLKESSLKRAEAIKKIGNGAQVVVTTIDAILQYIPRRVENLQLIKNNSYKQSEIIKKLVSIGYKRVETVSIVGEFSIRGDVIDIALTDAKTLLRLDFFDDQLESLKTFEIESKKTIGYVDSIDILPISDFIITEEEKENIIALMQKEVDLAPIREKGAWKDLRDEWQGYLLNGEYEKCQFAMPYLSSCTNNIFDVFSGVVIFDEPKSLYEIAELYEKEFISRFNAFYQDKKCFAFAKNMILDLNTFITRLEGKKLLSFATAITNNQFFPSYESIKITTQNTVSYNEIWKEFLNDVRGMLRSGYTIVICAEKVEDEQKVELQLERDKIKYVRCKDFDVQNNAINFVNAPLERGIIYPDEKLAILTTKEMVYVGANNRPKVKKEATFFVAPEVGDYVVHNVHGVGKVIGTKRIHSLDGAKDYISIEYLNGTIYVPVESFDVLTKYIGSEETPRLSKLGNGAFERVKEKVIESLKLLSIDLRALYKERRERKGFRFEESELEQAFISSFGFTDTEDQVTACEDIKKDMCSEKVMDRLVCGDVGFGKTEVAFRAIFRAVMNGKQAVLLAPTTILTEQHYRTAIKRFEGFGVNIAVLNRFKSDVEQKKIISDLKEGKIDFIIGTHRLLSKDIEFYDLGLLVLDEEQRFGVEHKEKIKLLKTNVDTLTLTATPIPRTLNMSLSGIRDISTIATPPEGRLPVQTYVCEENDAMLKDSIEREIARGGQVYILYNRVESIEYFASRIENLVPNAKTIFAHGQMTTIELEDRIKRFYDGKADILIATTIIENGIDLPKANTLIVIDADRLGLSSLYQLKGRVGRSNRLARAYFTYKKDKVLSGVAYERLSALVDFAEMGSGFKIAMRDLQIRGAGNVLGKEQHGHIAKIGYELYSRLLKETMTGQKKQDVVLNIAISSIIPESYVPNSTGRMEIYKEISEADSFDNIDRIENRLVEYYGELPESTENLLKIAKVKLVCQTIGISEVFLDNKRAYFELPDVSIFKHEGLNRAMERYKNNVFLSCANTIKIEFKVQKNTSLTFNDMMNFIFFANM